MSVGLPRPTNAARRHSFPPQGGKVGMGGGLFPSFRVCAAIPTIFPDQPKFRGAAAFFPVNFKFFGCQMVLPRWQLAWHRCQLTFHPRKKKKKVPDDWAPLPIDFAARNMNFSGDKTVCHRCPIIRHRWQTVLSPRNFPIFCVPIFYPTILNHYNQGIIPVTEVQNKWAPWQNRWPPVPTRKSDWKSIGHPRPTLSTRQYRLPPR